MIRKAVTAFILIPLAMIIISFAVANRQTVVVSFDPFDQSNPALAFPLPLYVLILLLAVAGVIVGGIAAWLRQGRWRSRARAAERHARELKAENERLSREGALPGPSAEAAMALDHAPRLSIPPPPR